jgi:hypothetical protein
MDIHRPKQVRVGHGVAGFLDGRAIADCSDHLRGICLRDLIFIFRPRDAAPRSFDGQPGFFPPEANPDLTHACACYKPVDQLIALNGGFPPSIIGEEKFPLDLDRHRS